MIDQILNLRSIVYMWGVMGMVFMTVLERLGLSFGGLKAWERELHGLTEMAAHDRILTPRAQIKDRISYIPLLGAGHTDIFHRRGVIAPVIVDIAESPGATGRCPLLGRVAPSL